MVDVKTQTKPVNPRAAIREARQRRLRVITAGKASTIKVYASNDAMREVLRHPGGGRGGIPFRDRLDQPVEWPNDSFTARRIADGSVRTDGPGSAEWSPDDESLNPRQQAAARKAAPAKKSEPSQEQGHGHRNRSHQKPEPDEPQPAA